MADESAKYRREQAWKDGAPKRIKDLAALLEAAGSPGTVPVFTCEVQKTWYGRQRLVEFAVDLWPVGDHEWRSNDPGRTHPTFVTPEGKVRQATIQNSRGGRLWLLWSDSYDHRPRSFVDVADNFALLASSHGITLPEQVSQPEPDQ